MKKVIKICAWGAVVFAVVCIALMLICNQIVVNNTEEEMVTDVDSIVAISDSLIAHKNRLEVYYRQITDPLEEIIDGQNSFDYVPINNKTIAWYKKCRTTLIKVYDSSHPASELSDNAKVDSLFMELEYHFELNNEEILDKHWGIFNQRMRKSMILYRTTERTIEMLQRHDNFEKEQKAWERMQMTLESFYLTAEELLYTGGSGNDALCLMAMNAIYKNREDDLKRMLYGKGTTAMDILTSRRFFIHSIDSIDHKITEEFTKEEWKAWKDIPQLIDKMQKAKKPLIESLDAWIVERKKYNGCANSIMDLNQTISEVR